MRASTVGIEDLVEEAFETLEGNSVTQTALKVVDRHWPDIDPVLAELATDGLAKRVQEALREDRKYLASDTRAPRRGRSMPVFGPALMRRGLLAAMFADATGVQKPFGMLTAPELRALAEKYRRQGVSCLRRADVCERFANAVDQYRVRCPFDLPTDVQEELSHDWA